MNIFHIFFKLQEWYQIAQRITVLTMFWEFRRVSFVNSAGLRSRFIDFQWQKQPSRGVLKKRCSENMPQIYRRTPMPKCTFNKVAKQPYWNRTLAWVFSCKFAAYFQNTFSQEHLWVAAFAVVINQIQFTIFIPTRTVTVIDYSDIINLLQVLVFLAKMSDKDLNKIYQIYQKERRLKKMIC